MDNKKNCAFVIPVYDHPRRIIDVAEKALSYGLPVFVVDDGSTDDTPDMLAAAKGVRVLRHETNRGKGAALLTGFRAAARVARWAVTLDADGQHDPADAWRLMDAIPDTGRPLIVGRRTGMIRDRAPWTSRFGRRFSNFWVALSGGPNLKDTQSGFRVYPLPECLDLKVLSRRFEFEIEILVKARWKKIPIIEVPVGVNYPAGGERISHFRPFWDFMRNTALFTRLIVQRLLVRPFSGP